MRSFEVNLDLTDLLASCPVPRLKLSRKFRSVVALVFLDVTLTQTGNFRFHHSAVHYEIGDLVATCWPEICDTLERQMTADALVAELACLKQTLIADLGFWFPGVAPTKLAFDGWLNDRERYLARVLVEE